MDVYILGRSNWTREMLIDNYVSFIWTERYNAKGDFELVVVSTPEYRKNLTPGKYVSVKESDRLMEILEVNDGENEEGEKILTCKGYSIEYLFEDRIALSPGSSAAPWTWRTRRVPASHARNLYREICYDNIRDTKNHFNSFDIDETPEPGRIPEPSELVYFEFEPKVLYDAIAETCQTYDLGFGLFIKDHKQLHILDRPFVYKVYTGRDRTTTQSVNAPVVFSPDLDNLENTHSITSSAKFKNVALVFYDQWMLHVWPEGVATNIASRNRRLLLVKISSDTNVNMTEEERLEFMRQKGREELAKHRVLEAYDGEIDQYSSQYLYGRDYGLGDLVEMRNQDGVTNKMMVTEQIFASDGEGVRNYPTLTLFNYIQPGSWASWDTQRQWVEMTTEQWSELP